MKRITRPTLVDVAAHNGFAVESSSALPDQFDGFQDSNDTPRFIIVNQTLPAGEQAFFIARELGYRWQQQRVRSFVFDKPWKWEVLNHASDEECEKICRLDAELRGYWLLLICASGRELRDFVKRNPKRWLKLAFADHIAAFHFQKIRARIFWGRLRRVFACA